MDGPTRSEPLGLDLAALESQRAWVLRLARGLTSDPQRAEDAVQETLLEGLRRGWGAGRWTRPFTLGVLRNRLRSESRRERRRREREARAAEPAAPADATDELVARAEVHRRLVERVLALPEPHRRTLLERHLEERSVADMAARAGCSPEAMRKRVARAQAALRAALERDGGARAWRASLLLLTAPAAPPSAGTVPSTSTITSTAIAPAVALPLTGVLVPKLVLSLGVLCTLGLLAFLAGGPLDRASRPRPSAPLAPDGGLADGGLATAGTPGAIGGGTTAAGSPERVPGAAPRDDAALEVRLRSLAGEPVPDARVEVRLDAPAGSPDPAPVGAAAAGPDAPDPDAPDPSAAAGPWEARTDAAGLARLDGLPPGVPLRVRVRRSPGGVRPELPWPAHPDADALELRAGEVRALDLAIALTTRVEGVALSPEGAPVPGEEIVLTAPLGDLPSIGRGLRREDAVAVATTDAAGRFAFEGVPPGDHALGPAGMEYRVSRDAEGVETWHGVADPCAMHLVPLEVPVGVPVLRREVRVCRGLALSGTLLDPDGAPAPGVRVHGALEGADGSRSAVTDEAGRFRLEPLVAGTHRLFVIDGPGDACLPGEVRAEAGTDGLELRLVRGGALAGELVPPRAGYGGTGWLWITQDEHGPAPGQGKTIGTDPRSGFAFRAGSLTPGTYSLYHASHDHAYQGWLRNVHVRADLEVGGLRLELRPAAPLTLVNGSDRTLRVELCAEDGGRFRLLHLGPGAERTTAAPPGRVRVRARTTDGEGLPERVLALEAGVEHREVLLDADGEAPGR